MECGMKGGTRPAQGSRFIILRLYRLAAGGSRERLHVMQLYRKFHFSPQRNRYDEENITLGYSREPPANHVCRPYPTLRRISQGSPGTCQSGSPPSPGRLHTPCLKPSRTRTRTRTRTITIELGPPPLAPCYFAW